MSGRWREDIISTLTIQLWSPQGNVGPCPAAFFAFRQIYFAGYQPFFTARLAEGISVAVYHQGLAGKCHITFLACSVAHGNENVVLVCLYPDFPFEKVQRFRGQVGCGNQNQFRSHGCRGPDAFWEMAVETDDNADFAPGSIIDLETFWRGGVILQFVKLRCTGNMDHGRAAQEFS